MGFAAYSDDELERVVRVWEATTPAPGSVGETAKRDALAEWKRRHRTEDSA